MMGLLSKYNFKKFTDLFNVFTRKNNDVVAFFPEIMGALPEKNHREIWHLWRMMPIEPVVPVPPRKAYHFLWHHGSTGYSRLPKQIPGVVQRVSLPITWIITTDRVTSFYNWWCRRHAAAFGPKIAQSGTRRCCTAPPLDLSLYQNWKGDKT